MGLKIGNKNIDTVLFYKEGAVYPSGTLTISAQSGVYDVTNYAFVKTTYQDTLFDKRIEGTLSGTYTNSQINRINRPYAFAGLNITNINLPNCSSISSSVFAYCSSLISVSLPQCSYIDVSAFQYCSSLTSINLPQCSYIGASAFESCHSLTSVNLPRCNFIGPGAFLNCHSLTSINLPLCSYIGTYAFAYCSSLTSISLPLCSYIGNSAFQSCTSLTSIYLISTSVVNLNNSNAFYNTPISNSTYTGAFGSIFVPQSLLASYKTATN